MYKWTVTVESNKILFSAVLARFRKRFPMAQALSTNLLCNWVMRTIGQIIHTRVAGLVYYSHIVATLAGLSLCSSCSAHELGILQKHSARFMMREFAFDQFILILQMRR